ncbi:MAG: prolyl oligopeptidase family serine peptidase [Candidatus Omnitrophota bacterium]
MNSIHTRRVNRPGMSRRTMIQTSAWSTLGLWGSGWLNPVAGQAAVSSEKGDYAALNRFPRMMQEYFVDRIVRIDEDNKKRISSLQSRTDAEAYIQSVRQKIRECFGPFPEKTPLNPRITGIVDRDAYRIEKVIFESRPNFLVTSNLYIPKGKSFPLPGIVGSCGHSDNGKAAEPYQSFAQGLARLGYVVLIYDPIGQGERLQYPDENLHSRYRPGVGEHIQAGNQQFLVGEFIGSWRAWDGIRALDYLLSREEVDPHHIGVTGNSGGGTMTTWLCGLESRWTMAAPGCFVVTFRRNLENELPADTEQCPPKALALGLDHADFIAAMAPKPVILLGKEKDFFDIRGLEEAYARLRRIYKLLSAEENIGLFAGPTYHGYSQELREAMYRWFNNATHVSTAQSEPELVIEKDETLWCTPRGQVCELGSRTVFSFTKEKSEQLAKQRSRLSGDALKQAVAAALKMPQSQGVPEFRILRALPSRQYPKPHFATYAVETEPGIFALVYRLAQESLYSRPPRDAKRAVLYVSHLSSDDELHNEPLIRELIESEPGAAFYSCDVRGVGESKPNTCGADFSNPYGCDYFYAIHSIMLDYPYTGQKTYDLLRVIALLNSCGHSEIHIAAKGWGALPAAFASLLTESVVQITFKNAPVSFTQIAETEDYKWPLSTLLPDVLKTFDLPDCYQALENKKLRQIEPWGAAPELG